MVGLPLLLKNPCCINKKIRIPTFFLVYVTDQMAAMISIFKKTKLTKHNQIKCVETIFPALLKFIRFMKFDSFRRNFIRSRASFLFFSTMELWWVVDTKDSVNLLSPYNNTTVYQSWIIFPGKALMTKEWYMGN